MFSPHCALFVVIALWVLFGKWLRQVVLQGSGMTCVPLMVVMMVLVAVRHTRVVCWWRRDFPVDLPSVSMMCRSAAITQITEAMSSGLHFRGFLQISTRAKVEINNDQCVHSVFSNHSNHNASLPVAVLLRSYGQSGGMDPLCHWEASSHLGCSGGVEMVMGHWQVMALTQDEMTKQKSINICHTGWDVTTGGATAQK